MTDPGDGGGVTVVFDLFTSLISDFCSVFVTDPGGGGGVTSVQMEMEAETQAAAGSVTVSARGVKREATQSLAHVASHLTCADSQQGMEGLSSIKRETPGVDRHSPQHSLDRSTIIREEQPGKV